MIKGVRIEAHFVRFIFPFALKDPPAGRFHPLSRPSIEDQPFQEILQRIDQEKRWEPIPDRQLEYILPHVEDFLNSSGSKDPRQRYVFAYRMSNDARQRFFSNRRAEFVHRQQGRDIPSLLHCAEVELYLFRSGVGLLILEFELQPSSRPGASKEKQRVGWETLLEFNHRCRRLPFGSNRNGFFRLPAVPHGQPALPRQTDGDPPESNFREVSLDEVIGELLEPIGKEETAWTPFYEKRLVGYTYLFFSRRDEWIAPQPIEYEELRRPLFWFRRYQDKSYWPSEEDLQLAGNSEIVHPFENVYFGLSLEGGVTIVWDNGDPFFRENFADRVRKNYFVLFLVAFHQRLAMIRMASHVANMSYLRHSHSPFRRSVIKEIQRLRNRIFDFTVRCWFSQVSNMKMYADVYRSWQDVLEVDRLYAEVKGEVDELDDYMQRAQMDQQTRMMALLTWVFLPFSMMFGFFGMNFQEMANLSLWDGHLWKKMLSVLGIYYSIIWLLHRKKG